MTLKLDDFEPVAHVVDNGTPEGSAEWVPCSGLGKPIKVGDNLHPASQLQQLIDQCNAKDVRIIELDKSVLDAGGRGKTFTHYIAQLATLQAQNAELLADAERWRTLDSMRKADEKEGLVIAWYDVNAPQRISGLCGRDPVAIIDAAIANAKGGE